MHLTIHSYGGTVNINGLDLRGPEAKPEIDPAIIAANVGADPETLADIGYPPEVATTEETIPAQTPEDKDIDYAALEKSEEVANKEWGAFLLRRTYLLRVVEDLGKSHRLDGFLTHGRQALKNRKSVESAMVSSTKSAEDNLKRACAICPYAGDCALKNNIERWESTHYYADSDKKRPYGYERPFVPPEAEGRMKFVRRLERDRTQHCIPKNPKA